MKRHQNILNVLNGVCQGGILSPLLFNVYFDHVSSKLNDIHVCCLIGSRIFNHLLYADDLVIVSLNATALQKLIFHCVNISYLVDRCISPACSRSRQTLEKNVPSWALIRTSSVISTHQVATQHPASLLCVCAHAYFLFLFGAKVTSQIFLERLFPQFLLRSSSLPSGTQCLSRVVTPDTANSRKKSSNDRPSISTQPLVTR